MTEPCTCTACKKVGRITLSELMCGGVLTVVAINIAIVFMSPAVPFIVGAGIGFISYIKSVTFGHAALEVRKDRIFDLNSIPHMGVGAFIAVFVCGGQFLWENNILWGVIASITGVLVIFFAISRNTRKAEQDLTECGIP